MMQTNSSQADRITRVATTAATDDVRSRQSSGACDYWLPPHVFVCVTQDCVVFLDALRDKYLGVGGHEGHALETLLATDSRQTGQVHSINMSNLSGTLQSLAQLGLLTRDRENGKPFRLVDVEIGSSALGPGTEYDAAPRPRHVLMAIVACISARIDLRFRGIHTVAASLSAKGRKRPIAVQTDPAELRRLVSIFRIIRPFLFSKRDRCLFHGLALHRFLEYYGLHTTWVVGVSTAPFSAHCWVQSGGQILDDSPERTLEYTPIVAL